MCKYCDIDKGMSSPEVDHKGNYRDNAEVFIWDNGNDDFDLSVEVIVRGYEGFELYLDIPITNCPYCGKKLKTKELY